MTHRVLRERNTFGEDNGLVWIVQRDGCTRRISGREQVRLAGQSELSCSRQRERLVLRSAAGRPVRCLFVALVQSPQPQLTGAALQDSEGVERIGRKPDVQVSAPVQKRIRRRLGLAFGSKIEWCRTGDDVSVRPASKFSSRDIHEAVFHVLPERRCIAGLDEGIRFRARRLHAPL